MNASDLFVKALENEGVAHVYGVPGEENLVFPEALRKSRIQLILTRHEQGAAFMAATCGRLCRLIPAVQPKQSSDPPAPLFAGRRN